MQETQVQSLGGEDPRRRKWQPTPGYLPGEFHGQRQQGLIMFFVPSTGGQSGEAYGPVSEQYF